MLTLADVRGTNPKLWNSWKASLFRDLYELTSRALRRGLENPIDREQLILETRDEARQILSASGISGERIDQAWRVFNDNYFLRHRTDEIVWHTKWLAASDMDSEVGLVDVRRQVNGDSVEAVLYTPKSQQTFAHAAAALDELGMTIMDARVVPIENGYSLDTFIFMELDKRMDIDESRMNEIRSSLTRILMSSDDGVAIVTRSAPRQVRMFRTKTSVDFSQDTTRGRTVMELVAADRPGLLSKVGKVFVDECIEIDAAKVMTIGERAEDVFYISTESGAPLDDAAKKSLRAALIATIDESDVTGPAN